MTMLLPLGFADFLIDCGFRLPHAGFVKAEDTYIWPFWGKEKGKGEEKMGSVNSNNWLSFPLSPNQSSLQANLQASQSHQFSLGLVNEPMNNPFQNQGINNI